MKRLLLSLIIGAIPTQLWAATTAHWALDDNAASTTVVATTGSNGTLEGGDNTSTIHSATGPGGSVVASLDLDGSADAIDVGTQLQRSGAGVAHSLLLWVNLDSVTSQHLFGRHDNASNQRVSIDNSTTITVRSSSSATFTSPVTLSTGTWYCILITFDTSDNVRVFVNGTASSSNPQTLATSLICNRIGRVLAVFLNGRVAWCKVFNSDESANAATLYAEGVDSSSAVPIIVQQLNGPDPIIQVIE